MEIHIFLFLVVGASVLCFIRLLRPDISIYERAFLIVIISTLVYLGFDKHTRYNLSIVTVRDKVQNIIGLVQDAVSDEIEFTLPVKAILESDRILLNSLLALTKYLKYDSDAVLSILKLITVFYELYADTLLGIKDIRYNIKSLINVRYELLKKLHTMFVSMPQSKHTKVFEHISLIIQSSTYKSLNVLKNKYGTTDHEPPLPENVFDSSFEVY